MGRLGHGSAAWAVIPAAAKKQAALTNARRREDCMMAPVSRNRSLHVNQALERLANELGLNEPAEERLRLEFGYACAVRVQHFIEEQAVADCLASLGKFLRGTIDRAHLEEQALQAARLANQHQGSKSIDGAGHAAVSATYAVANALAGKALQAAEYAAYAVVYGQGGYGAVSDPESFEPELRWQVARLSSLATRDDST
jgi:hypothetical protein